MREVAEQAHVSVTTVSHVINDTRPVSDELPKNTCDQRRLARSLT